MNKVIANIGLLIFFVSIIFFSRMGLPAQDVLIRSVSVSIILTIMLSIIVILFVRTINKIGISKKNESHKV